MPPNPHVEIERKLLARRAEAPLPSRLLRALGPLFLGLCASVLARPVLLWFLDSGEESYASGLAGISFRLALFLCGAMVMAAHASVLRGPHRAVLDPHPVDPAMLLPALRRRLLHDNLWLALGTTALLAPLLVHDHGRSFFLAASLVLLGWLNGVSLGIVTQLGAVWAADSRFTQAFLEAARGSNPRMQAALIYAPGFAIAVAGLTFYLATRGLESALAGDPTAILPFLPAMLLPALVWKFAPSLAGRYWYRATTLLSEVDAQWASLEAGDERGRVYLDWMARWIPPALRPYVLKDLRMGWRSLRSWVLGAWGAGLLAALPAWSASPEAPERALLLTVSALAVLAVVAMRMARLDPPWLGLALALPLPAILGARFLVVLAYLQATVLPPSLALVLRQNSSAAGFSVAAESMALCCALAATISSQSRRRAFFLYLPLSLLCWALLVGGIS